MVRLQIFFILLPLFVFAACSQSRSPASMELPPVMPIGVAHVEADQPPVVKTEYGYVPSSIPGVPPTPTPPLQYVTFTGVSN